MQNGARFFAYLTWVLMVSMGIILFSHQFFGFMNDSFWLKGVIAAAFGFLYFNLTYAAVKRYIRKVPAPTNLHIVLAVIIFLPPSVWVFIATGLPLADQLLLCALLIPASISGTVYGNRAGIRARYEYIQQLKQNRNRQD